MRYLKLGHIFTLNTSHHKKGPPLVLHDKSFGLHCDDRGVGRSNLRLTTAHGTGGASTKLKANAPNDPPAQNRQNNGSFNGAKPLNDERQEKQVRGRGWRGEEGMERRGGNGEE